MLGDHPNGMCSITSWSIFPANIDFATDDKGALSCCIHEGLMCLFIVCETTFKIGESWAISHANGTEQQAEQWLQIFAGEDFPPKLLWSENTDLKFIASGEEDNNRKPWSKENIAWHREGNVVNTVTTNMYRGSDKILQLHCKRNWWREETPTPDALKSDEERQGLKFTVKIIFFDATIGSNSLFDL